MDGQRTPIADRPRMPEGYGVPENDEGLISWEHVEERLREAPNYWVATVDARNRPHATPVWGAYLDGLVFLDGSTETRRGQNMAGNPHVTVHLAWARASSSGCSGTQTPNDQSGWRAIAAGRARRSASVRGRPVPLS